MSKKDWENLDRSTQISYIVIKIEKLGYEKFLSKGGDLWRKKTNYNI